MRPTIRLKLRWKIYEFWRGLADYAEKKHKRMVWKLIADSEGYNWERHAD